MEFYSGSTKQHFQEYMPIDVILHFILTYIKFETQAQGLPFYKKYPTKKNFSALETKLFLAYFFWPITKIENSEISESFLLLQILIDLNKF